MLGDGFGDLVDGWRGQQQGALFLGKDTILESSTASLKDGVHYGRTDPSNNGDRETTQTLLLGGRRRQQCLSKAQQNDRQEKSVALLAHREPLAHAFPDIWELGAVLRDASSSPCHACSEDLLGNHALKKASSDSVAQKLGREAVAKGLGGPIEEDRERSLVPKDRCLLGNSEVFDGSSVDDDVRPQKTTVASSPLLLDVIALNEESRTPLKEL
nr:hypothetical protein Iba_chr02eCG6910 [Ipomoea batatas]